MSEPRQRLRGFDQHARATVLDHARRPLALSRSMFAPVRSAATCYAKLHHEALWDLGLALGARRVRTLRQRFDRVGSHNTKHIGQTRAALKRQ